MSQYSISLHLSLWMLKAIYLLFYGAFEKGEMRKHGIILSFSHKYEFLWHCNTFLNGSMREESQRTSTCNLSLLWINLSWEAPTTGRFKYMQRIRKWCHLQGAYITIMGLLFIFEINMPFYQGEFYLASWNSQPSWSKSMASLTSFDMTLWYGSSKYIFWDWL